MTAGNPGNNDTVKPAAWDSPSESSTGAGEHECNHLQPRSTEQGSAVKNPETGSILPGALRAKFEHYVKDNPADPLGRKNLAYLYNSLLSRDEKRYIAGSDYGDPDSGMNRITDKLMALLVGEKICTQAGPGSFILKLRSFLHGTPPVTGDAVKQGDNMTDEMEKLVFPLAVRVEDMEVMANEIPWHAKRLPGLKDFTGRNASLMLGDHVLASGRIIEAENGSPAFETGDVILDGNSPDTPMLRQILLDYPLNLSVETGRKYITAHEASRIGPGTVISFDNPAAGPVDLVSDGTDTVIAGGEIVALGESFGIRITDYTCGGTAGVMAGPVSRRAGKIDEALNVPLKCVVGRRKVTLGDFAGIGEGSIIELDSTVFSPVEVIIGNDIKLQGEVVVINGNFGVRITGDSRERFLPAEGPGCRENDNTGDVTVQVDEAPGTGRPFSFLETAGPQNIVDFLQGEHPQTIALVLSFLSPRPCAAVLEGLPYELRGEISMRIAGMRNVSSDVIRGIEHVLEKKMAMLAPSDSVKPGGIDSVVEMLGIAGRQMEKTVMSYISENDPDLAEEIRKRIFMFEDIAVLDDRSVQKVLREVDTQDLVLSLKGASAEVMDKIFRNMSKRASSLLREDMDYMGPVRLRDVENAQQKIVNIIRRLEGAGEILIVRHGEDKLVV